MPQQLDYLLFGLFNYHLSHPRLDALVVWLTELGNGWSGFLLALVLVRHQLRRQHWRLWLWTGGGIACAAICNGLLKYSLARPRPATVAAALVAPLRVVGEPLYYNSMPSGHTVSAFCAATVIAMLRPRAAIPALLMATAVGLSRIYLGAHFPSDVLVGAALATVCTVLGIAMGQRSRGEGLLSR